MTNRAIDRYDLVEKVYKKYNKFQKSLIKPIKYFVENSLNTVNILEIGSGTGITTNIILESDQNIELTSIDIDPYAINFLKKQFTEQNKDNLKLLNVDAFDFLKSCQNNSYDIVISAFTIHNFTSQYRIKFYKELYRVMSENSIFLNADKYSPENIKARIEALKYRISKYIDIFMYENEPELLKEWIAHYIDDLSADKVMLISESQKLLTKFGFKNIEIEKENDIEMMALLSARKTI